MPDIVVNKIHLGEFGSLEQSRPTIMVGRDCSRLPRIYTNGSFLRLEDVNFRPNISQK